MALSSLQAGNSRGLNSNYKFNSSQNNSTVVLNGVVSGSTTAVQFTVNMDPRDFTCALGGDNSRVLITFQGRYNASQANVYTVDTGMDITRASAGSTVLTVQVMPQNSSSGTTYTFTKSTGGGIEA